MRHLSRKRIAACVSVNLAVILAIVSWRSAEPVLAQACGGVERWAVKVGSDAAAPTINLPSQNSNDN